MNNQYRICTLSQAKHWFEKAVPNPELKNFNAQTGTHFEEVLEMIQCLEGVDDATSFFLSHVAGSLLALSAHLKSNSKDHLLKIIDGCEIDFLDSLCDQIVTATGVAHMSGHDIIRAMDEVNDSNFSKFEDGQPLFDANRKICKGKHYRKANLEPFLKK